MMPSTLIRRITQGGLQRRSLQQILRRSSTLRETQTLLSRSPPTLICRQSSTDRFLNARPITCHPSRLCHGHRPGVPHAKDEAFSMKALAQAPKPALYLGLSGLLPFVSAPLFMAATGSFCPQVAHAQVVYGATIVSFLGGARWGFAIPEGSPARPDWMNLGNSVVPSLIAWLALLCRDNVAEGALLVLMGLGLSLHYDLTLLPGYPAWFKAMRTLLTLVATFSLVATLALKKFRHKEEAVTEPQS
ncbi:transmembrane protein 69 [Gadus morhua]|uniref:Transmembrane protein 69 n=1 Tax=Gadus morhua TaxID=8049 RepID=A0A8C4ZI30_GADMO|nr:transmembrane protein 69-like [Gadus morhua]XP_030218750.1 transmembrane protein 69-like [Gadus morhua]